MTKSNDFGIVICCHVVKTTLESPKLLKLQVKIVSVCEIPCHNVNNLEKSFVVIKVH